MYIALNGLGSAVKSMAVDVYNLNGKRVADRTFMVQDGAVSADLDLSNNLAQGLYLVSVTAGDKVWSERLLIQP